MARDWQAILSYKNAAKASVFKGNNQPSEGVCFSSGLTLKASKWQKRQQNIWQVMKLPVLIILETFLKEFIPHLPRQSLTKAKP